MFGEAIDSPGLGGGYRSVKMQATPRQIVWNKRLRSIISITLPKYHMHIYLYQSSISIIGKIFKSWLSATKRREFVAAHDIHYLLQVGLLGDRQTRPHGAVLGRRWGFRRCVHGIGRGGGGTSTARLRGRRVDALALGGGRGRNAKIRHRRPRGCKGVFCFSPRFVCMYVCSTS